MSTISFFSSLVSSTIASFSGNVSILLVSDLRDKISAFNEISVTVSSGVADEDSVTLIKTILNNRLLNHANPLEYIEVIDLFKLPKISVEKQDENISNSVYSDLLGLHEG